jgi:glutamate dehydrogenase/leucine dehydrogenase
MSQAFDKVYEVAKSRNLSLRLAAFYVAIERVAKATELGGF